MPKQDKQDLDRELNATSRRRMKPIAPVLAALKLARAFVHDNANDDGELAGIIDAAIAKAKGL